MLKKEENVATENIPFFPLGVVVLPGETRFIHVFETRYKNLFEDLEKFGNYFGIPFVSRGNVYEIGSLVKLEKVLAKYPNGELDIAVKGIDIFSISRLKAEHPQRLYPYGDIFLLNKTSVELTKSLLNLFEEYSEKVLKVDLTKYPKLGFYLIANSIGLTDLEKYEILMQPTGKAMSRTLSNHLRLRIVLAHQYNSIADYYSLN
ncbi:MAG TPA: LON peptidase substrate-binding domain-containing protein [Ignavibacteria bacterium]|jgi:hypothetical protein